MVVRYDEEVNARNVIYAVSLRPREALRGERYRGSVSAKYRVHENPLTVKLDEIGRVSEPNEDVLGGRQVAQIRFNMRNGIGRNIPLVGIEDEFVEHAKKISSVAEIGRRHLVMKSAITVIGRPLYACQAFPAGQFAKLRLPRKPPGADIDQYSCRYQEN